MSYVSLRESTEAERQRKKEREREREREKLSNAFINLHNTPIRKNDKKYGKIIKFLFPIS